MSKQFYQVIEIVVTWLVASMGIMSCGYCVVSIILGIMGGKL